MYSCPKRVLITGFTPFKGVETNPSWEGVDCMDTDEIQNKYNIEMIKAEINVLYAEVDEKIPMMWRDLRPALTIHVGASTEAPCFLLETQARRREYIVPDNHNCIPVNRQNVLRGPGTVFTQLDVAAIYNNFNHPCRYPKDRLQAKISNDAGQFLCEYIYYTSLCIGQSPTLFVHVPVGKYTTQELALGLERILGSCLEQLARDDYYAYNVVQW